jgi:hypothetical protein
MVSLFAIPKPFEGHVGAIQMNAVRSWVALRPRCEIILLGDEPGTAEAAARWDLRYLPEVARNERGTPLLHSVFEQAERAAAHDILCYVNADIILLRDFMDAVAVVRRQVWPAVIIGRRWDVDLHAPWDVTHPLSESQLRQYLSQHGRRQAIYAMDYFVFPRRLWRDIPAFAIGRTLWDNWLVYQALALRIPVVDASEMVTAIHQCHDYAHVPGGTIAAWQGREAQRNLQLLGGIDHIFDIRDATWMLTADGGLRIARGARRVVRQLVHTPGLRALLRPLRMAKRGFVQGRQRHWARLET